MEHWVQGCTCGEHLDLAYWGSPAAVQAIPLAALERAWGEQHTGPDCGPASVTEAEAIRRRKLDTGTSPEQLRRLLTQLLSGRGDQTPVLLHIGELGVNDWRGRQGLLLKDAAGVEYEVTISERSLAENSLD